MKTFDTWMNEAYSSVEKKQHANTRYGDNFKLPLRVPGEKIGPPDTATREFVRTPDPYRNPAEAPPRRKGASKDAKWINSDPISKLLQHLRNRKRVHQIKRDAVSSRNTFVRGQSKYQFGTMDARSRIYPYYGGTKYGGPGNVPGVI